MIDDTGENGNADRVLINMHEDYELRSWARRLEVTLDDIRDAVQTVGNAADAVRKHLGK